MVKLLELLNENVESILELISLGLVCRDSLVRPSVDAGLSPGFNHLMYELKSKFVTAFIPLYSIAAIS